MLLLLLLLLLLLPGSRHGEALQHLQGRVQGSGWC
jgi:hypothetical protein